MNYKNTIEAIKHIASIENFAVLSGYNLSYQDFEEGNALEEESGMQPKTICISWDGMEFYEKAEDSTFCSKSEEISIYLRTDEQFLEYIETLVEQINSYNHFKQINKTVKTIEINRVSVILQEKAKFVAQIQISVYAG